MQPAHLRLAELYHLHKARGLTDAEALELWQCLQVNAQYCWDSLMLRQLTNLAVTTRDDDWFREIGRREEALRLTGRAPTL
ncbi:DUF7667 family protein [Paenibacillus sp. FSL L8-0708]|uniref:DUF7667 family protein n=1 Tax=Paenibacillus sp. FSL L8-0708 TaxID=2975311 RepID=UPI0030F5E3B9